MESLFVNSEPIIFIENIKEHFSKLFDDKQIGKNIETGIYNYTVQEASFRQIIKKWKNPHFCDIYSGRLRSMVLNIHKNKELF